MLQGLQIFRNEVIGGGSNGNLIFKGAYKGKECAVKRISRTDPKYDKRAILEAQVGFSLDHPNIAKTYHRLEMADYQFIFMEYIDGYDLFNFIPSDGGLEDSKMKVIFEQICLATQYFHKFNIVHNDIKLDNIMINPKTLKIKIIDFGLCQVMKSRSELSNIFRGTVEYCAPEVLLRYTHDPFLADVWSMGVVLYGMACSRFPFITDDIKKIKSFKDVPFITAPYDISISPDLRNLLSQILVADPKYRIPLDDIVNHRWLKKSNSFFDMCI
jgi:serine/threonine-protein kinase HSL1 (negative regulator of Swe1 kinase)